MAVGNNNNTKLAFLAVVVCLVVAAPAAEAAITCGTVTSKLIPCLNYLRTGAGPTPACCGGVKALVAAAQTTPDRQAACACLKQTAAAVKGFSYSYAAALPGKCSVSVPYPINPSVDCSKIH